MRDELANLTDHQQTALDRYRQARGLAPRPTQPDAGPIVILLDNSGSMGQSTSNGTSRRTTARKALTDLWPMPNARLYVFADTAALISHPNEATTAQVGDTTDIASAIRKAAEHNPRMILVIGDGAPNDEPETIDAARVANRPICTLYIGNPGDRGEDFMIRLAHTTGGQHITKDLEQKLLAPLAQTIKGLLPG